MSVLPGESVSALGGAGQLGQFGQSVAAGYERQQEHLNALHKARLDALSLSVSPMMMCNSQAPPTKQNMTATQVAMQQQMAAQTTRSIAGDHMRHLLNQILPEQCRKHVYKVDHEHLVVEHCEIVKWTFFNDLSIRLKVHSILDQGSDTLEPIIDDFELWQADALMKCEAGEDVWPRPKPVDPLSGVASSQQSGKLNSSQNLQRQQSLAGLGQANQQAAIGNALSNALGMGGLFK